MSNPTPTRDYHHGLLRFGDLTQDRPGTLGTHRGAPGIGDDPFLDATYYDGGSGNDDAAGYDYLYGYGGHDQLEVGGGHYGEAYGGNGDDILYLTGESFGLLNGGPGNDTLAFEGFGTGLYDDTFFGGDGNDFLRAGGGYDHLYGGEGRDSLSAGEGSELYGGEGNDSGTIDVPAAYQPTGTPTYWTVTAGLFGNPSDDRLYGGTGKDSLWGEEGRDILVGGRDKDELDGGLGEDVFRYDTITDSVPGAKCDVIADFQAGVDSIDLSRIDANTIVGGDQRFTLIGGQPFHNIAGELRFKNGIAAGDVNGDGTADFEIKVQGDAVGSGDWAL